MLAADNLSTHMHEFGNCMRKVVVEGLRRKRIYCGDKIVLKSGKPLVIIVMEKEAMGHCRSM